MILQEYLATAIQEIKFDGRQYTYKDKPVRGLHSALSCTYYPTYEHSTRRGRKTQKKSSSAKQGITVDQQIGRFVLTRNRSVLKHRMARAIVDKLTQLGYILIASQVPVYIASLCCCTQADLIALDGQSRQLHLFEIKTGYPPAGHKKKGSLQRLPLVGNSIYNHWQLQLHYTQLGLQAHGVPITGSTIVNVFDKVLGPGQRTVEVKLIPQAKWVGKYRHLLK